MFTIHSVLTHILDGFCGKKRRGIFWLQVGNFLSICRQHSIQRSRDIKEKSFDIHFAKSFRIWHWNLGLIITLISFNFSCIYLCNVLQCWATLYENRLWSPARSLHTSEMGLFKVTNRQFQGFKREMQYFICLYSLILSNATAIIFYKNLQRGHKDSLSKQVEGQFLHKEEF